MSENKIEELEILIAHQDKKIEELNDIVTKQWEEIDTLKTHLKRTKLKMDEMENSISDLGKGEPMSVADIAAAEKPPHY